MMSLRKISKTIYFQLFLSAIFASAFSYWVILYKKITLNVYTILGFSFITFGLLWFFLFLFHHLFNNVNIVWFLFPAIISVSIGIPFSLMALRFLDFVLYIGLGIGISFFIAGIYWRLFGLVIPGSLLIGIPPGLYFAWENTDAINALQQTGIMLVTFAFGWGIITIASRALTKSFVWWPLIPGGILAVVGWALYIAGNPESAIGFIGNTGSVGLIIFGIYILLMRRSFHQ